MEANLSISFEDAMQQWWKISSEHHFRLSYRGWKDLRPITESFKFITNSRMEGYFYLNLGKLNCAYFVHLTAKEKAIHIFSTKIATVIQLYGSIDKYLKTLK